jgi:hypothetical protein
MKNITKKQSKEFNQKVKSLLLECDFEIAEEKNGREEFTAFVSGMGNLSVYLYPQNESSVYSICCRFDEPDKAKQFLDCNPFSGKYNFHRFDDKEIYSDFSRFIHWINAWIEPKLKAVA